jgi:uncharacterized surface protein with fasciclin (FAS1) repeats
MTTLEHWMMIGALSVGAVALAGCGGKKDPQREAAQPANQAALERAPFKPPVDPNNIVSIAVASADHKTLVAALQAADYVTSVANPGPLTVFAPTDAAFGKLPAGTVEMLVKPENVDKLRGILKYHVTTSSYMPDKLTDGMDLGMADGGHATITSKDGKLMINDATIVASVRASNGVVHVIDGVLTPPAK